MGRVERIPPLTRVSVMLRVTKTRQVLFKKRAFQKMLKEAKPWQGYDGA